MEIESFWEYSDPALSEERFRIALASSSGDDRLELLTQIARTYSLRQRFDEAHAVLDEVEPQLTVAGPRPQIRYLLERGRTFNSHGDKETARGLFVAAWEQGQAAGIEGLAVDAAHMVAITYAGTPDSIAWNQRGLAIARASNDAKAQALIPALLNNMAWEMHEIGRFAEALPLFEQAQVEWSARGKLKQIQIAKWSVARCLRSLGRYQDALAIQQALEAEHTAAGTIDGYVFEEIAKNLEALGEAQAAALYVRKAADALDKH